MFEIDFQFLCECSMFFVGCKVLGKLRSAFARLKRINAFSLFHTPYSILQCSRVLHRCFPSSSPFFPRYFTRRSRVLRWFAGFLPRETLMPPKTGDLYVAFRVHFIA